MGSSNSTENKDSKCDICGESLTIYIPTECKKDKQCLTCTVNHLTYCTNCYSTSSTNEENKEIRRALQIMKSHFMSYQAQVIRLEDTVSESESTKNQLNLRYQEEIKGLNKKIKLLEPYVEILRNAQTEKTNTERTLSELKAENTELRSTVERLTAELLQLSSPKTTSASEHEISTPTLASKVNDLDDTFSTQSSITAQYESELETSRIPVKIIAQPESKITPSPSNSYDPTYFLDVGNKNVIIGRITIRCLPKAAPNMCEVFHNFVTGKTGIYLGSKVVKICQNRNYIVFQNAKTKGKEYDKMYPTDKNELPITKGAVGMRIQGYQDGQQLVKSQFYIVLNDEVPNDKQFSYVFGHVIDGYSVCSAISHMDVNDNIEIMDLGELPKKVLRN